MAVTERIVLHFDANSLPFRKVRTCGFDKSHGLLGFAASHMSRHPISLRRGRGQTFVEFAMLLGPLLVLLLSVVIVFLWFSNWNQWHYAAVQGTVAGTSQGATQVSAAQASINALTKVAGLPSGVVTCSSGAGANLIAHYDGTSWTCFFTGNACMANGTSYAANYGVNDKSPKPQVWICVPQIPQGASCSNNGTASVYLSGFVPSPAPVPNWGFGVLPHWSDYLAIATQDTETVQVPQGDASC